MVQRTFGAIKAAGTQVREVSGGRTIQASELGWAGMAGILERGPVGEPIFMLNAKDAERKIGGLISDSLAPDAIFDFMREANGAGGVVAVRVTDGNEVAASIPLYTRTALRRKMGTLQAKNGGRWGGAEKRMTASVALVADIGEATLDTGLLSTMKVDEWAGASLALAGVPNKTYTVTGNSNAGILFVDADATMATDLAAGADPTNKQYYLLLENSGRALSAVISDGDDSPSTEFSLDVYLNGQRVIGWRDLSTDPDSGNYWVSIINDDSSNEYVTAVDEWTGAHTPAIRPANHYSTFSSLTATTLTSVIHDFVIDGTGNPTVALGTTTDEMVAQTITITMTGATTFTASSDVFGALGSGTFGVEFAPANKWIPPFTITAGADAMTAADEIALVYKPLKARALIGGRLFPDKDSDATLSYRIVNNTHKVITVAAGSTMSTDVAPIAGVSAAGSIQFATAANHVDGESFILNDGKTPAITFHIDKSGTYTPVGGYNATNIRLDISAATSENDVATVFKTEMDALPSSFLISAAAPNGTGLVALTNDATGEQGNVTITETVTHATFIATGMTGGITESTNEFMVSAALELAGGRDGNSEITDDHYEAAWSQDTSPFLLIKGRNMGLLQFSTPGVTATAVQRAGIDYAWLMNHSYMVEIPPNITTETAADDYLMNTIGRSDRSAYACTFFPSYGYVNDPLATKKLKRVPLTGMISGLMAAFARNHTGYHKAAAGIDAILSKVVKLTVDSPLNEEFLNPRGINIVRKRRGSYIVWGDRTLQSGDPEWTWLHQRKQMSHYENTLLENTDSFIFAINDPATQAEAKAVLIAYFRPEYANRALRGDSFEDACIIKVDAENNTDATMAAGDMHAEVSLRLADTVERFIITAGKQGVLENVA